MRRMTILAATAGALLLSGCGITGGQLIKEGVPTGTIVVTNNSNITFTAITISDCNAMSHGFNRMPGNGRLPPGSSQSWKVSQGCYDVMVGGNGWVAGDGSYGYDHGTQKVQVIAGRTHRLGWGPKK